MLTDDDVERFHRKYEIVLRYIVRAMGLQEDQYDIEHIPGVTGYGVVSLHTDHIYVMMGGWSWSMDNFQYRACNGRKDYLGGENMYASIKDLKHPEKVMDMLYREALRGQLFYDQRKRNTKR